MKHTRGYIRLLVLFAFLALCGAGEASAQVPLDRYRSAKTFVRSGLMPKPDSLAKNHLTDSLLLMRVDSLLQDSTLRDSLLRSGIDSLRLRDSLAARLHPASENRLPARSTRSARLARRPKRPPPPARYHLAVGRKLDLAGSARFRTDLQQAILEAADPLRNGRCGTDPLLPRKQHLQTSQTTIQRPAGKRYGPHGGVGRRTVPYDPQQYAQADLSRAYGRLLPLLPGRCGGQLPLRRLPRKESHDTGHDLPRCRTSL